MRQHCCVVVDAAAAVVVVAAAAVVADASFSFHRPMHSFLFVRDSTKGFNELLRS